jgi:hypothetical protein
MRRLGIIVALCTALGMVGGVATSTPALAGRGPKWEVTSAQPFTLPAEFCGFRVRVTWPVIKAYAKVLKSSDGSEITLATGAARASYTNLSTGKSITENVSGPVKETTHPDGSFTDAIKGHTAVFFPRPDVAKQFGLPRVGVTAGPITFSFGPDGHLTSLSFHGHVLVDVCAALS